MKRLQIEVLWDFKASNICRIYYKPATNQTKEDK